MKKALLILSVAIVCGSGSYMVLAQTAVPANPMTFFITSRGPGNGANLGGLAGADGHCQGLADTVGAGGRTWRAYLSTQATATEPAVNARDRIGSGPFVNAAGVVVAMDVDQLHGDMNNLNKQTALNERGEVVIGVGDQPNRHDMITGSQQDGRAFPAGADQTCSNYTSQDQGVVRLGHHDRNGGGEFRMSWNSAHPSRGCSQQNLISTGGDGLFYCFAIN
jgi:hypothetical protein